MVSISQKFQILDTDNAPGQEVRQSECGIRNLMLGDILLGQSVDFSHGDVDAFTPTPGSFDRFSEAVKEGGRRAYTEYRGSADIRAELAQKLETFTGAPVSSDDGLILTQAKQARPSCRE